MKKSIISPLVSQNTIRTKALSVAIRTVVTVMLIAATATGCGVNEPLETTMSPTTAPVVTTAPVTEPPTAPPETTVPPETTAPVALGTKETPYPAGSYVVGKDIAPGDYVFLPDDKTVTGLFRLSDTETVEYTFYGQFFWTLKDGAKIAAENCHFFPADDYVPPMNDDGTYGPGMYRIGIDIPLGGYTVNPANADTPAVWHLYTPVSDSLAQGMHSRIVTDVVYTFYFYSGGWNAIFLENCTLTAVGKNNFLIPDAPVPQELSALPLSYEASDLVFPYYRYIDDGGTIGDSPYYITLPTIYPFSEDAVACQQDIYNTILPTLEYYSKVKGYRGHDPAAQPFDTIQIEISPDGIGYDTYLCGNTLTIIVWTKLPCQPVEHHVFALDLSTGKRLWEADTRTKFDITDKDIYHFLENTLANVYPWYFGPGKIDPTNITEPQQRLINKMLTDENIASSQVYVNNDGSICVATDIYSIITASYYSLLLPYTVTDPS